jgi:hypothetical protein
MIEKLKDDNKLLCKGMLKARSKPSAGAPQASSSDGEIRILKEKIEQENNV